MTAPNPARWSHLTFTELNKRSPRLAYEFRRDTLGDAIPDHLLTAEEKAAETIKTGEFTLDESTVEKKFEEKELSGEELLETIRVQLRAKDIKFHPSAGEKRLFELAKEHGLI